MKYIFTLSAFLIILQGSALAQDPELDRLRQAPPKESLPVKIPELEVQEVEIPQSTLNLKVDYWRTWTSFGINANQASFSENWNGGGVNSISIGGTFDRKSVYTKDDKNFTTQLILQYGMLKNKNQLARKSNDRIFWDNKAALKLSKSWSLFASLAWETQFSEGYSYGKKKSDSSQDSITGTISNFMAPGYITESVGIEFTPDKSFSLRFGTGTARQTFILDDRLVYDNKKSFGVDT